MKGPGWAALWLAAGMCTAGEIVGVGHGEAWCVGDAAEGRTVVFDEGGALHKTGAGEWSVPNLLFFGTAGVFADEGTLNFAFASAVPETAAPAAALDRAALWLKADVNVKQVAAADAGYDNADSPVVTRWMDCRAADADSYTDGGGRAFFGALSVNAGTLTNSAGLHLAPVVRTGYGADGDGAIVYFNGFGSGTTMRISTAEKDGSTAAPASAAVKIEPVQHAFLVYYVENKAGSVLASGASDFAPPDFGTGSATLGIWRANSYDGRAARIGETWLNGRLVERVNETNLRQNTLQVLETHADPQTSPQVYGFFSDRFNALPRHGGGGLAEVLLFTNRLYETDRRAVELYLLKKWIPRSEWGLTEGPAQVGAASGGRLAVKVDADETRALVWARDAGTLVKNGAGTLTVPATPESAAAPADVEVNGGALRVDLPMRMCPAAGTRLTMDTNLVTRAADAGAGTVVKDGCGDATFTGLGAGVRKLRVTDGMLTLTAPRAGGGAETFPELVPGAVPNADFSAHVWTTEHDEQDYLAGWTTRQELSIDGWDYAVYKEGDVAGIPVTISGSPDPWVGLIHGQGKPAARAVWFRDNPPGGTVVGLRGYATASTTLTLPRDGVYEIRPLAQVNTVTDRQWPLCVGLVAADGATNWVAYLTPRPAEWRRCAVRLPYLAAGTHRIVIGALKDRISAAFTDVQVFRVAAAADPLDIGGDFEAFSGVERNNGLWTDVLDGWTFGTAGAAGATVAGVVMPCQDKSETARKLYVPSKRHGCCQVRLAAQGYVERVITGLPAGTYRLTCDVSLAPVTTSGSTTHVLAEVTDVTEGAGAATALGTVKTDTGVWRYDAPFPNTFTVAAGRTLKLRLSLRGNSADTTAVTDAAKNVVNIDSVRLADVVAGAEFITHGGFENTSGWAGRAGTTTSYNAGIEAVYENAHVDWADKYGPFVYDGSFVLRLTGDATCARTVTLPRDGLYRVRLHTGSRVCRSGLRGKEYGLNPLRVFLADGAVTNTVAEFLERSETGTRHEFLFRAAAGTYQFGFKGLATDGDHTTLIDGVSVTCADDLDGELELPEELEIALGADAKLCLDFEGTRTVRNVTVGGHYLGGLLNGETCPAHFTGLGSLWTPYQGTMLIFR